MIRAIVTRMGVGCGKTAIAVMLTPPAEPLFRSASTRKAGPVVRSLASPIVEVDV